VPFVPTIPADRPSTGLTAAVQAAVPSPDAGTFGVAVKSLTTGETALINADAPFPSASLYKTAVMYEFYRQKALGQVSVNDVLTEQSWDYEDDGANLVGQPGAQVAAGTALQLMMTISDNVAAHMIEDRVGRTHINRTLDELGLHMTRVGPFGPDAPDLLDGYAYTTPRDMLKLYQLLAGGTAVDGVASREMLNLLLANQVNDRLPALLPPGTPVAHKNGELDGVLNDAGIVYGPKGPFAIAVLSRNVPGINAEPYPTGPAADAGMANVAQIAAAAYTYLEH
jgi:beta-lactamase class A